jgi:hypothetical protein
MRLPAQAGHRGQHDADDVEDWLKRTYREDFGGDGTQVIYTDKSGEVSKKDLDKARDAVHTVESIPPCR